VFRDKTRLRGGEDWTAVREEQARSCAVMLVIIGSTWKTVRFETGNSACFPRLQADCANPLERAAARQSLLAEFEAAINRGALTDEDAERVEWFFVAGSPLMPSLESRLPATTFH
jgi:hypothetical protein